MMQVLKRFLYMIVLSSQVLWCSLQEHDLSQVIKSNSKICQMIEHFNTEVSAVQEWVKCPMLHHVLNELMDQQKAFEQKQISDLHSLCTATQLQLNCLAKLEKTVIHAPKLMPDNPEVDQRAFYRYAVMISDYQGSAIVSMQTKVTNLKGQFFARRGY
ncbi:MAG: hypothetical protein OXC30_05405 [Alphaproteobacteria bacterium]|nr:hypothetical protein [Alphaproteobacteria bacterium]